MNNQIEVGCLVRIMQSTWHNDLKDERWGIVIADEAIDNEEYRERWARWTVVTPDGDYVGCHSSELELMEEEHNGSYRITTLNQND